MALDDLADARRGSQKGSEQAQGQEVDMNDHNYLTSNNKVNGWILEDGWSPQWSRTADALVWFGFRRGWVWQSVNNSDSLYTDETRNQFALRCFYRPHWLSVTSNSGDRLSLCVLHLILLLSCCTWESPWNHWGWFFVGTTQFFSFFFCACTHFRWVTSDEMTFMSAPYANQKHSSSARCNGWA